MNVCVCVYTAISYHVVPRSQFFISLSGTIWPSLATMSLIFRQPREHKHRSERPCRRKWNPWTFLLWAKAANRWVTIEAQQKTEVMPIRCLPSAGMCKRVDTDSENNKTATIVMLLVIAHWDFCQAPLSRWNSSYAEAAWHDGPQARLLMWSTSDTGASDNRQEIKDTEPSFAKKKPSDTPKVWILGPICCQLSFILSAFCFSPPDMGIFFLSALLNFTDLYKN